MCRVLNQDSSRLSSKLGYYNTKTKYFRYIGDVEIINPQYVLCTDSLDYDTYTKLAIFKTFTTIKVKTETFRLIKANITLRPKSLFEGRAKVTNDKYSLEGDTLAFDNTKGSGYANGAVVFVSFEDSLVVLGQKAIRNGEEGLTKIMKETLSRRISKNDTLWIAADTLWVFEIREKVDSVASFTGRSDSLKTKYGFTTQSFKSKSETCHKRRQNGGNGVEENLVWNEASQN